MTASDDAIFRENAGTPEQLPHRARLRIAGGLLGPGIGSPFTASSVPQEDPGWDSDAHLQNVFRLDVSAVGVVGAAPA